jgi:hypothetical protein
MKQEMDDINSKLSQLYDNELNQDQLDDVLKNLNSNLQLQKKYSSYGLISDVLSSSPAEKVTFVDFAKKVLSNRLVGNGLTAAATIFLTVLFLYDPEANRLAESSEQSRQIRDAVASEEAAIISNNIMQNEIRHLISLDNNYQPMSSIDLSPVGYNQIKGSPDTFQKGKKKVRIRITNNQSGLNEIRFFDYGHTAVYLYPLDDKIVSISGDLSQDEVEKIIKVLIN